MKTKAPYLACDVWNIPPPAIAEWGWNHRSHRNQLYVSTKFPKSLRSPKAKITKICRVIDITVINDISEIPKITKITKRTKIPKSLKSPSAPLQDPSPRPFRLIAILCHQMSATLLQYVPALHVIALVMPQSDNYKKTITSPMSPERLLQEAKTISTCLERQLSTAITAFYSVEAFMQ